MRFEILDVGHGFCAYAVAEDGGVVLFDCGHKSDPEFRPSTYLMQQGITRVTRFVVTNYDQDHISDLPNLREAIGIDLLRRNKSVSPDVLRTMKEEEGPISAAMESLLEMMGRYTGGPPQPPPALPGVECASFSNGYPDFEDANNLSLVTFLDVGSKRFIIPGDIEVPGWKRLLEGKSFRDYLAGVDVFIASHHGRESGYCSDVFKYATQVEVVIMSDGPLQYATQEMVDAYAGHVSGIMFNNELRKVLTTRKDGGLTWTL